MSDLKSKFMEVYSDLKSELLRDSIFEWDDASRQWVDTVLDYNLQAFFLVYDDIMDNSHTRRGQPCYFRIPQVGLIAVNDSVLIRNHIHRILKNHFKGKPYYVDLLDLFNEVEFQTASGQMIDLITTLEGEKDLNKYNLDRQVASALLIFGENLDDHVDVKNILIDMGIYFQVQDDFLDCYGDPAVIGKIGTDIEDFKCSWLVVKALELCDEQQRKLLIENYGKEDQNCVAKVKQLYKELNLQAVFDEYENKSYEKLCKSIDAHPSQGIQAVLRSFLGKIYKRQNLNIWELIKTNQLPFSGPGGRLPVLDLAALPLISHVIGTFDHLDSAP
ncbi:hypothetical protein V2J09_015187 [Rumex salicifolius]